MSQPKEEEEEERKNNKSGHGKSWFFVIEAPNLGIRNLFPGHFLLPFRNLVSDPKSERSITVFWKFPFFIAGVRAEKWNLGPFLFTRQSRSWKSPFFCSRVAESRNLNLFPGQFLPRFRNLVSDPEFAQSITVFWQFPFFIGGVRAEKWKLGPFLFFRFSGKLRKNGSKWVTKSFP